MCFRSMASAYAYQLNLFQVSYIDFTPSLRILIFKTLSELTKGNGSYLDKPGTLPCWRVLLGLRVLLLLLLLVTCITTFVW